MGTRDSFHENKFQEMVRRCVEGWVCPEMKIVEKDTEVEMNPQNRSGRRLCRWIGLWLSFRGVSVGINLPKYFPLTDLTIYPGT